MIPRADFPHMDFADIAPGIPLPPRTPGDVPAEDFMRPLSLSARALAAQLGIPGNRISVIRDATHGITAETALLPGRRFGTSAELWMNLQSVHDLAAARPAP